MASTEMTLHVELMGQDRDLLERTCENLEWYRKHLQEQAQMIQVEGKTERIMSGTFESQVMQEAQEAQKRHGAMIAHEAKEQIL